MVPVDPPAGAEEAVLDLGVQRGALVGAPEHGDALDGVVLLGERRLEGASAVDQAGVELAVERVVHAHPCGLVLETRVASGLGGFLVGPFE